MLSQLDTYRKLPAKGKMRSRHVCILLACKLGSHNITILGLWWFLEVCFLQTERVS